MIVHVNYHYHLFFQLVEQISSFCYIQENVQYFTRHTFQRMWNLFWCSASVKTSVHMTSQSSGFFVFETPYLSSGRAIPAFLDLLCCTFKKHFPVSKAILHALYFSWFEYMFIICPERGFCKECLLGELITSGNGMKYF